MNRSGTADFSGRRVDVASGIELFVGVAPESFIAWARHATFLV